MKRPTELAIPLDRESVTALVYDASTTRLGPTLLLAHGAGAGQLSGFMVGAAHAMASRGLDVVTFNFLYTERRRRVPDRAPALEACYRAVIDTVQSALGSRAHDLYIGGKSMGGRIATNVAAADRALRIRGLVLLGYPLHPPGQPDRRRDTHLPVIDKPVLFVQGSRDTFGTPAELAPAITVMSAPTLYVVDGGDHSFKVGRGGADGQALVLNAIYDRILSWMDQLTRDAVLQSARRQPRGLRRDAPE